MTKQSEKNYFSIGNIISVASVGLLYGFDRTAIKLIYFFDSFRIYFKLDSWDGTCRNIYGTKLNDELIKNTEDNIFRNLKQTDNEDLIEAMITFGYIIGAILGAYIISLFTEKIGRKNLILISTIIYSLGCFISACSVRTSDIPIIFTLGRFITGMSIGALSVTCPLYISELSPANYRGIYIYVYYIFVVIGIIISSSISLIFFFMNNINMTDKNIPRQKIDEPINNKDWRRIFTIEGIIGLVYLLIIYRIVESPRWLCYNERYIKALTIFNKLNKSEISDSKSIEKYETIKDDAIFNRSVGNSNYSELWISGTRRYTIIIFFLYFFQQWTGYVIYKCLENQTLTGSDTILNLSLLIPTIITCISLFFIMFSVLTLTEQIGRKLLLILGTILLIIINCSSIINGSFDTNISKSLVSGPLFNNRYKCTNDIINNTLPYYTKEDTKTNFYKDSCHENVVYCTSTRDWISWDGIEILNNNDYYSSTSEACGKFDNSMKTSDFFGKKYGVLIFVTIFICIWEPIPSIYQSEIFPMRIRDKGGSVGIISKYINQGLVTYIGPQLISSKGKLGMFPFVICTCLSLFFIIFFCPETKNIELEDMETKLSNKNNNNILNNESLESMTPIKDKIKYKLQEEE